MSQVSRGVVTLAEVEPQVAAPARPRAEIGVLASLNFPDMTEPVAELIGRFTRVALESLHALGASYRLFDTSHPLPDPTVVADCDALLLLGGGDIDPSCYGGSAHGGARSYGVDLRADRDALEAIAAAIGADRPVLGICRGAQLLNVHYGGTIIEDIEDYVLHRGHDGEPMFIDEEVRLLAGNRVADILGAGPLLVRSGHHQAVDRLGDGLRLAAVAADGIVEGFDDPTRWLVGVQWHPEDDDGLHHDRMRLFAALVDEAASRRSLAGHAVGGRTAPG